MKYKTGNNDKKKEIKINLDKEGFIGIKNDHDNYKTYFYYLTYSNRAEIYSSERLPFEYKNNIQIYYNWQKFRNEQPIKKQTSIIELVLSLSRNANLYCNLKYGMEEWTKIQDRFVLKMLEEYLYDYKGFLTFRHLIDSTGIRQHYHVLIMPYKDGKEKLLGKEITEARWYFEKQKLLEMKKEYNNFIRQHIKEEKISGIEYNNEIIFDPFIKNINNFEYFEMEQELKLDEEILKIDIMNTKQEELNYYKIFNLLFLSHYDKELYNYLFNKINKEIILKYIEELEKKEFKNKRKKTKINKVLVYFLNDYILELYKRKRINEEEFLNIYLKFYKNIRIKELKNVISDNLLLLNNKEIIIPKMNIIENNIKKQENIKNNIKKEENNKNNNNENNIFIKLK